MKNYNIVGCSNKKSWNKINLIKQRIIKNEIKKSKKLRYNKIT
jgi:hypothetical protein